MYSRCQTNKTFWPFDTQYHFKLFPALTCTLAFIWGQLLQSEENDGKKFVKIMLRGTLPCKL